MKTWIRLLLRFERLPEGFGSFSGSGKRPNAQMWMKVMAAKVAAEGESFATSMFLWKDIYDSTPDPSVKKNALQHLQLLKVKEDCKQLDALADEYAKRFGKRPARMSEMVQAGLLPGIPRDPLGFAYILARTEKRSSIWIARSSNNSCCSIVSSNLRS